MKFVLEETFRGNDFATKKISHQIFLEKTPNLKKKLLSFDSISPTKYCFPQRNLNQIF